MTYPCITTLTYFLTNTLNCQVLLGREKYLLNGLYETLKNKVSLKHVNSKESVSSKDKQIN